MIVEQMLKLSRQTGLRVQGTIKTAEGNEHAAFRSRLCAPPVGRQRLPSPRDNFDFDRETDKGLQDQVAVGCVTSAAASLFKGLGVVRRASTISKHHPAAEIRKRAGCMPLSTAPAHTARCETRTVPTALSVKPQDNRRRLTRPRACILTGAKHCLRWPGAQILCQTFEMKLRGFCRSMLILEVRHNSKL